MTANKPDSPSPALAPWFQVKHHWRGVGDAQRSPIKYHA